MQELPVRRGQDLRDYRSIFEARGHRYNDAMAMCPHARDREARVVLDALGDPGSMFCDAPAGGGFLAGQVAAAHPDTQIVCVEPSQRFAAAIPNGFDTRVCPLDAIDLPDNTVSSLGSLAGTHHLESPAAFFGEALRVLVPGGRIVVADVAADTPTAVWLNECVHALNPDGHVGRFFAEGELAEVLSDTGFSEVLERCECFAWRFDDLAVTVSFFREMFGLGASDATIERELVRVLPPVECAGDIEVPWSLVVAEGRVPADG